MTNVIKNYNSIDPSNGIKDCKSDSIQSKTHFKVSELVNPIFNKIKELCSHHLGSPTYLIANKEDIFIQKALKVAGWVFLISPAILITACLYDALKDLYHQHVQKYSRMQEYSTETREDLSTQETLKDGSSSIPVMDQETIENTSQTIQEESEDNLSNTPEKKLEVPQELSAQAEDRHSPINEEEPKSISNIEIFKEVHNEEMSDSLRTLNNEEELEREANQKSFEIIKIPHDLQEEINNAPKVTSYRKSLWKRIKTFNPFRSKTSNVVIPSNSTIDENTREPSYEDLKISSPIFVSHENDEIKPTAFSIDQIKKEFNRMKIFINGNRCLNIQEFVNHLNLTLNVNETDILPGYNPLINKILHFSHQALFMPTFAALHSHITPLFPDRFPTQIKNRDDRPFTLHINWNPKFPEKTEITGEISFYITYIGNESHSPYIYKTKTRHSLDKEEIYCEVIEDIPELLKPLEKLVQSEDEIESPFVMVNCSDTTEKTEQSDDDFTMIGSSIATESDNEGFEEFEVSDSDNTINYNRDIAFNHLTNKTNPCLTSTVTSEYLTYLKKKFPNFVFNDRLMFPVPITTDEIANSLNKLKNNNSNQLIFLPFLVKGRSVDHAVVAVMNLSNETIEYFDPKATSTFRLLARKEKQSNKNVLDFLTEIGQKVITSSFSREKILQNKKNIPQGIFDDKNCGAFCLQFIEERITRPFDSIEDDPAIDPTKLRVQLANKLIENNYSN